MVAGGSVAGASGRIFVPALSKSCSLLAARADAYRFCLKADAGNSQAKLTWDRPAARDNFAIYEESSQGIGKPINPDTATDTSALVTHLTNGTTYHFWLVVGQMRASNIASATPAAEVPGPPARLTATPGNTEVTLSWAAPASDGGSPVTSYNVYQGTTAEFTGRAPVAKVTAISHTVTGLVNGTTYFFQVTAVNPVGEGQASQVSAVPVTVPGAPAGLTVTPGDTRVRLAWTAPASNGGTSISGYNVYYATSADFKGPPRSPG
jgi:Fibronectin type III domain